MAAGDGGMLLGFTAYLLIEQREGVEGRSLHSGLSPTGGGRSGIGATEHADDVDAPADGSGVGLVPGGRELDLLELSLEGRHLAEVEGSRSGWSWEGGVVGHEASCF